MKKNILSTLLPNAGASTWNTLPDILKCSKHSLPTIKCHLKHFLYPPSKNVVNIEKDYEVDCSVRRCVCHSVCVSVYTMTNK